MPLGTVQCIFFKKLNHFCGTFAKKKKFPPRKVKTLVKIFRIAKIGEKWLIIRVPPHFSPKNSFFQNDSEWLEKDFKHNFIQTITRACELDLFRMLVFI